MLLPTKNKKAVTKTRRSSIFALCTQRIAALIHCSDVSTPTRARPDPGPTEACGPHDLRKADEEAASVSNGLWRGCPFTSTDPQQLSATSASRALNGRRALRACALGAFWPASRRRQRTPGHTDYHGASDAVTAVAGTTPSHPTSPSTSRLTKARTFPAPFAPVICVALLMLLPRYLWTDPFPNSCNISAGRKRARGASGTCCSFLWI